MIYRGQDSELHRVALQKKNRNYYFLHWPKDGRMSTVSKDLTYFDYISIGHTMLVEWSDD